MVTSCPRRRMALILFRWPCIFARGVTKTGLAMKSLASNNWFGHIWPHYMAICGHIWPMYGHICAIYGPYMATYGHIWPYMAHIWPVYDHIWPVHGPYMVHIWAIYGHIWPYMGHIWPYMAHIWPYLYDLLSGAIILTHLFELSRRISV